MPPLPDDSVQMLFDKYQLTTKDSKTLVDLDDGNRLDYFLDVVPLIQQNLQQAPRSGPAMPPSTIGKAAANWVLHELGGLLSKTSTPFTPDLVPSTELAAIVTRVLRNDITGRTAKYLLATIFSTSSQPGRFRSVEQIIQQENLLLRPMALDEYVHLATEVLKGREKIVEDIRKGEVRKLKFLVGQMIRMGEDVAVEPQEAERVMKALLMLSAD